jgi:hypothetical protein
MRSEGLEKKFKSNKQGLKNLEKFQSLEVCPKELAKILVNKEQGPKDFENSCFGNGWKPAKHSWKLVVNG